MMLMHALDSAPRRWPSVVQACCTIALAVSMVACATVRPASEPAEPRDHFNGMRNSILISIDVIENAPAHPRIQFRLGQTKVGAPPPEPPPPDANRMTAAEYAAFRELIEANDEARIVAAPRVLTQSEERARVDVGSQDAGGGYVIEVEPDVAANGQIRLFLSYEAWGLPTRPPASEYDDGDRVRARSSDLMIEPGQTHFALATGYIGAPTQLLAISAYVIDPQGASMDLSAVEAPAPTHIDFYAVVVLIRAEPLFEDTFRGQTSS